MNDTEEEDLALYGEPVSDDNNPSESAGVPAKNVNLNEEPIPSHTNGVPADDEEQFAAKDTATAAANDASVTENVSEAEPQGSKENIEANSGTNTALLNPNTVTPPVEKESIIESGEGPGGGSKEPEDEKEQNNPDVVNGKAEKEGNDDEGGNSGDEDDDDDDEDDDDDDDDDDDSEDDDFDVILNYDDNDAQPKPPNASFGSIGKVRLSSNKWQRPGYVPPERVIGAPTQGAARTGGVLAMLPTPTMQIGGAQKSVYDLEIGKLTEKPWLDRNADLSDYFNYGFNEETWKLYCERQKQMRLEASMLAKIKTVDGNKPQAMTGGRAAAPGSPKQLQAQVGARINASSVTANHGSQNKPPQQTNQPMPPPPPPPGMMQPPIGFEGRPGGMLSIPPGKVPNMAKMPGMPPNMPFPFPAGAPNPKGGNFQPPFPPFFPMPGGQRNGDGKSGNMFPMMPPGMPAMPPGMHIPPGGMPPGVGPDPGGDARGFPGAMQTPQQMHPPQTKDGKPTGPQNQPHRDEQKRVNPQGQGSRFGNAQNGQQRGQSNRPGHHDGDRRQRWSDNRSHGDRRQGYDRQGGDRDRGRGGHDDRGYGDRADRGERGDRGYDRRRWAERDDGYDRRRGGGHDNQRYSDSRRDYDRDRDREYRKRSMSGRDYDDDRKRSRR